MFVAVITVAASLSAEMALAQALDGSAAADAASCQCACSGNAVMISADVPPAVSTAETAETSGQAAGPTDATNESSGVMVDKTTRPVIYFSELLPDPVGTDADGEFIEIRNAGSRDAALIGWAIRSKNEKIFNLPDVAIAAGGYRYFLYAESKVVLTNTGSELTLVDPEGLNVDFVAYSGTAKTGQSYAKNDIGQWLWTSLQTPGQANEFPSPATVDTAPENSASPQPGSPPTDATATADDATVTTVSDTPVTTATAPPAIDPAAVSSSGSGNVSGGSAAIAPQVVISEFLPNPVGDDAAEWIELANLSDLDVTLAGWSVDDDPGGSRPFVMTAVDVIPARGFLLLPKSRSGLALNNDGDSVRLTDMAGTLVDAVAYAGVPEGKSYVRTRAGWVWSGLPTPGAANEPENIDNSAILSVSALASTITPSDGENGPENTIPITAITELAGLDDGEQVTVSGLVNIPPGRLGKTLVGFQDLAGTNGLIVRLYGKTIPKMTVGEIWRMTGRIARINDELRLNVRIADARLTGAHTLTFQKRAISELDSEDNGIAVTVTGLAASYGRNWLTLTDAEGTGEIKITLPQGAQIGTKEAGAAVTASGIVRYSLDRSELIVMDKNDLKVTAAPAENQTADEPAPASEKMSEISRPPLVMREDMERVVGRSSWIVAALLIAGAASTFIWWRRRQLAGTAE
jgi:hypothetical protein